MEVLTSAIPEVGSYTIPCAESFHFDDESWLAKPAALSQHDAAVLRKIAACFITNGTNRIIPIQDENRKHCTGMHKPKRSTEDAKKRHLRTLNF